ncbi:MAG: hypothetical protein WC054_00365 [Candidatus Nanopelagicales bacterium]
MDPEEVVRLLSRDISYIQEIQASHVIDLSRRDLDAVAELADQIAEHARSLSEWYAHGGYRPKGLR